MAQVEFVSVIYQVFKNYRVEILRKEGETEEQAKERIREVIEDSSHKLTMQVNRPEDGWVRWVRR